MSATLAHTRIDSLESDPDAVDDIVLPADGIESNGVGVLVEDQRSGDTVLHDHETLGPDVERKDLDGVRDNVGSESDVVESVVEEDEGDDGVSGRAVGPDRDAIGIEGGVGPGVDGRADGPEDKHDTHAGGRGEEELSSADLVDSKSTKAAS